MNDEVKHPSHYNQGTIEIITVIQDWKLPFELGSAVKYIGRCRYKGSEIIDIEKAIDYLEKYRERRVKEEEVAD